MIMGVKSEMRAKMQPTDETAGSAQTLSQPSSTGQSHITGSC